MSRTLHRCPNCQTVGRVHRSKLRNLKERIIKIFVPVYGVYRCHHCNWRGWLTRSSTSPAVAKAVVIGYFIIAISLLAGVVFFIIKNWPNAKFRY
ncbi:MAG: hypothetical protein IT211_11255 [Armatimonadetes bacterium]|nr:hypothetical protein [Armatimonadota bacterium]